MAVAGWRIKSLGAEEARCGSKKARESSRPAKRLISGAGLGRRELRFWATYRQLGLQMVAGVHSGGHRVERRRDVVLVRELGVHVVVVVAGPSLT